MLTHLHPVVHQHALRVEQTCIDLLYPLLHATDGFDATALTKVDVAANRGAARLFATSVDACSEDDSDCIASYTSGDRKVSRLIMAKCLSGFKGTRQAADCLTSW
jgi:hypothetical protein